MVEVSQYCSVIYEVEHCSDVIHHLLHVITTFPTHIYKTISCQTLNLKDLRGVIPIPKALDSFLVLQTFSEITLDE
jgi:hypothetical protein